MKKLSFFGLLILPILAVLMLPSQVEAAEQIQDRIRGHILLQVEQHGEAYYVDPADDSVVYMPDGAAAYAIMRERGLGITDADLAKIPSVDSVHDMGDAPIVCGRNTIANRVRGRIVLQVEQHGEAWYIDPVHCQRVYMKDGAAAYEIMRFLGLGISDADLEPLIANAEPPAGYSTDFSDCEITVDGVMETAVCETGDLDIPTIYLSRNHATKDADAYMVINIYDQDEYEDGYATAPMMVNLMCEVMAAVVIEPEVLIDKVVVLFEALDVPLTDGDIEELRAMVSEGMEENPFTELMDGYNLRLHLAFDDGETGEPIAECVTRSGKYENIEFIAHRDYGNVPTVLDIQIGAEESVIDTIIYWVVMLEEMDSTTIDPTIEKDLGVTQDKLSDFGSFMGL